MKRVRCAQHIFEAILRNFAAGEWAPGAPIPSMRHLASEFRTSLSTVEEVIRKAARQGLLRVRPGCATTVLPGGRANARRLWLASAARQDTHRLAILMPQHLVPQPPAPDPTMRGWFYRTLVEALIHAGGLQQICCQVVPWPLEGQIAKAAALAKSDYAAALAIGFRPEHLISLYKLYERRFPVLTYNRKFLQFDLPSVRIDEYRAAQQLADLFVRRGHRNLCLVTHEWNSITGDDRKPVLTVQGWFDYLREHHLENECTLPVHFSDSSLLGLPLYGRAFENILASSERPTAILFSHGPWARMFLTDPRFDGLRVPEDISLAAFFNTPQPLLAERCPPLTTASVDIPRVAECAIEIASKLIAGQWETPSIRVPLTLNITASVGPPPRSTHSRARWPTRGKGETTRCAAAQIALSPKENGG